METIAVNQTVYGTIATGQNIQYSIKIPTAAKYVVQMGGTASVLFGIWEGSIAPGNGDLRVCGVARRGTRTLNADTHIIQVTGNSAGPFTLLVRPWNFGDYFTINFYGSTC